MAEKEDSEGKGEASADGRTTFNNIKGTKVYDADGEEVGRVSDVEVNLTTLNPTRLIIHKGFFGKYLRINLKYVEKVTRDSIQLWITPAKNLVGTKVMDIEDTEMGRVEEAQRSKDGDLEYIKAVTSLISTRDGEGKMDTYTIPITSFEDMSISLPPASFKEEPMPTHLDVDKRTLYIEADEIIDVGKDCIRLRKKKENYLDIK
ncbi:MAG: PRC-barrel domain-containing protein, partial [Candidatus Thermoplasmatota archaeon]